MTGFKVGAASLTGKANMGLHNYRLGYSPDPDQNARVEILSGRAEADLQGRALSALEAQSIFSMVTADSPLDLS